MAENYESTLLKTEEAAELLRLKPQTLRKWACTGYGPIKPIKIGFSLRWKRSEIEYLMNGEVNG